MNFFTPVTPKAIKKLRIDVAAVTSSGGTRLVIGDLAGLAEGLRILAAFGTLTK